MITVAIANAVVSLDGRKIPVQAGTAWSASDPVVKAHPEMFSTDERYLRTSVDRPVEQATAAPGEKRRVRR